MTKPVTDYMERTLMALRRGPFPVQEINAGAWWRLQRGGYADTVQRPSPYASHKGKSINFAEITEKGRKFLEDGI